MLMHALNYEAGERFVALYWEGGQLRGTDRNAEYALDERAWYVWLSFFHVARFLDTLDLGASRIDAEEWLLLDTLRDCLYVGSAQEIEDFLATENERVSQALREESLASDEAAQLSAAYRQLQQQHSATLSDVERDHQAVTLLRSMIAWLEGQALRLSVRGVLPDKHKADACGEVDLERESNF